MTTWLERFASVDPRVLPCHDRTALYFAPDRASQVAAQRLCSRCPALNACRHRTVELEELLGPLDGVWGGLLPHERRSRVTAVSQNSRKAS